MTGVQTCALPIFPSSRPALRKMFELYVDKGIELTGLLEGKSELADALQPVGQTDNLSAVVQFKVVPEPDKLLEKQELGELLEQIKAQADYVILDTPPMGIVRDAEVTAKSADAAILFIKQDEVKAAVSDVLYTAYVIFAEYSGMYFQL